MILESSTTALNGVYSLRVSNRWLVLPASQRCLKVPLAAAYGVSNRVWVPVQGVYGSQVAQSLNGSAGFTQICKSSVTVTDYHVSFARQS